MAVSQLFEFGPFRVDAAERLVWCGPRRLNLRGKSFDLLLVLIRSGGRALSKEELLATIWPGLAVEEGNLTVAMSKLRDVLREGNAAMDYIETLPGRGYRFLAAGRPAKSKSARPGSSGQHPAIVAVDANTQHERAPPLVGREAELAELRQCADAARSGIRQVVFIAGEAGMGKSAFVSRLLSDLRAQGGFLTVCGVCVESYGAGEPYLPIFSVLVQLCRGEAGTRARAALRHVAPAWAAQLPELWGASELAAIEQRLQGLSHQRMIREIAAFVTLVSADDPVAWCFEDLHWADYSTLELLSHLSRSEDGSPLLIVGTCRLAESEHRRSGLHGLLADLQLRRACRVITLPGLTPTQVEGYLQARFVPHRFPESLAPLIHRRTCGTPLFVVQWADALVDKALIRETVDGWELTIDVAKVGDNVPETTTLAIEMQVARLSQREQAVLDAAAVAGGTFAVVVLADALAEDQIAIEQLCLMWAKRSRLFRVVGEAEWPDGTRTTLCEFVHALYEEVLYRRLGAAQKAHLHRAVGRRLESAYGQKAVEVAAELALHFERGGEPARAARYFYLSGKTAVERCAPTIATAQLNRGLAQIGKLEDDTARQCIELDLQAALGSALSTVLGHAAPQVQRVYERVNQLDVAVGEAPLAARFGSWMAVFFRGEYQSADDLALQLFARTEGKADPTLAASASVMLGLTALYRGRLCDARRQLESGLQVLDFERRPDGSISYMLDPVFVGYNIVWAFWLLGFADKALSTIERALAAPNARRNRVGHGYLLHFASVLQELRGEHDAARARSQAMLPLFEGRELAFFSPLIDSQLALQNIYQRVAPPGLPELQANLSELIRVGTQVAITRPFALLTEALLMAGRYAEALAPLRSAFGYMLRTQERWWEAELHRLQGELWLDLLPLCQDAAGCDLGSSHAGTPEACFLKAIEVARAQDALALELRAATSLARLWRDQGDAPRARTLLEAVYSRFSEGFETKDLRAARTLLSSLA